MMRTRETRLEQARGAHVRRADAPPELVANLEGLLGYIREAREQLVTSLSLFPEDGPAPAEVLRQVAQQRGHHQPIRAGPRNVGEHDAHLVTRLGHRVQGRRPHRRGKGSVDCPGDVPDRRHAPRFDEVTAHPRQEIELDIRLAKRHAIHRLYPQQPGEVTMLHLRAGHGSNSV